MPSDVREERKRRIEGETQIKMDSGGENEQTGGQTDSRSASLSDRHTDRHRQTKWAPCAVVR